MGECELGYDVDGDRSRIDADAVWAFLSTEAGWARERTREQFDAQLAEAWRLVGAYRRDTGAQVGFARGIAVGPAFAYLADVFVLPGSRGAGLGRAIVAAMVDDEEARARKWMLFTSTARGLYERFGFTVLDEHADGDRPMVREPRV